MKRYRILRACYFWKGQMYQYKTGTIELRWQLIPMALSTYILSKTKTPIDNIY